MSMNWNQFLAGFQTGQQIGNDLGSQYALRQLQDEQVTQSTPISTPTKVAMEAGANAREMAMPRAGRVMPQAGGIPQPSGATTYPVGDAPPAPNAGISGTGLPSSVYQPPANAQPAPAIPNPDEVFQPTEYTFLGQKYGHNPTTLEKQIAQGNARADIYERFGKPAMAIAARSRAAELGAKAEMSGLRGFQLRDLKRQEDRALKAQGIDDLMARAYNGDADAQMEVFKKYPKTTIPGVGDTRIITNKDGSVKVEITKGGNTTSKPYASIAHVPQAQLMGLLQGAAPSLYAELGGEYATKARQDQLAMAQFGLSQQGQALQERRLDESIRQFNVKEESGKVAREQAQKNWTASMGMDIFRFNNETRRLMLQEKNINQQMEARAEQIRKMKNPPPTQWGTQLEILDNPWEESAPKIAWAMGLDIMDDLTLPAIEAWKETTYQDYLRKNTQAGNVDPNARPGPL